MDEHTDILEKQVRSLQHILAKQEQRIAELEERILRTHPSYSTSSFTSPPDASSSALLEEQIEDELLPLAQALSDAYDFDASVRHPRDLEHHQALVEGAEYVARSALSTSALLQLVGGGEHVMFGPMALKALLLRRIFLFEDVCSRLSDLEERGLHFALRYLCQTPWPSKIISVLKQASPWWSSNPSVCSSLRSFVQHSIQERGTFSYTSEDIKQLHPIASTVHSVLSALHLSELDGLQKALTEPQEKEDEHTFLREVGRIWDFKDAEAEHWVEHEYNQHILQQMEALLTGTARRSVLLLGKHGVGKTVSIRQLCCSLLKKDWVLFEASAADVLSGQRYVGQLEARVGSLLEALEAPRRVVWYIPDFHELLEKGATQQDTTGILDLILPAMERQRILVIGETRTELYTRLIRARHKLRYAAEALTLESADLEQTFSMAQQWAQQMHTSNEQDVVAPGVIEEAVQLSLQYFADQSLPGSIMQLLQQTYRRKHVDIDGESTFPFTLEDILETIARLTHLPARVLDDRERLDIESLQELFRKHVIGQDEAIGCLVDRIAMIKAGLTDPSRPLGVFFFAGPTGTGKTELAKTLCRFLFGSEQHMLRLDMSEYNDRDSYWRLIRPSDGRTQSSSLASQIQEQPFSVVLLDEVEKAHPQIWDLFLQVFDDGRLTDQNGHTVDFRHCMIILTSNVGSTIQKGSGVGFNTTQSEFVPDGVEKAIERTFRREFVNRLDQVVVFNPLSRSVMRDILHKELNGLLQRRGFRSKNWVVEWGASAVDFLLEKGFTPDLGARPLKRAIERYLLAPLAKTIVEHRFPEGNQFLFVRSDGQQIQVQFIDPDVPKEDIKQVEEPVLSIEHLTLKSIAFEAQGLEEEWLFLNERCQSLLQQLQASLWMSERVTTQERINEPNFLHAPDRYQILGKVELMDRVEAGLESSNGLLKRLRRVADLASQKESLKKLSQQLHILECAARDVLRDTPQDVLIQISGLPSKDLPVEASFDVFQHMKKMYQGWAERRRMRSMWLRRGSLQKMEAIFSISGLAAWSILQTEQGLHVFDLPKGDGHFYPTHVRVRVTPQPIEQASSNQSILTFATDYFSQDIDVSKTVCRHYRWAPSPQVHDRIRGWRTSEIGRVLAGDFDLLD